MSIEEELASGGKTEVKNIKYKARFHLYPTTLEV